MGDRAEDQAEWNALLKALGQLWLNGVDLDWAAFYSQERRRKIPLPTYPFARKRHWIEPLGTGTAQAPPLSAGPILEPPPAQALSAPLQALPVSREPRAKRLIPMIADVLEETTGEDLSGIEENVTFLEMGLDSLILTQLSLTLTRKFKVKISFRQLMEDLPTLKSLAAYLDQSMEPEAEPTGPVLGGPPVQLPAVPDVSQLTSLLPPSQAPSGTLEQVLDQQLKIISWQLEILGKTGQVPPPSKPLAPGPGPGIKEAGARTEKPEEPAKAFGAAARIKTVKQEITTAQKEAIVAFTREYNAKTRRSKEFTRRNRSVLADPRAVSGFNPVYKEVVYPIVIERSAGSRMWDLDHNEYIDMLMGFGANLFGHSPPFIIEAIREQLDKGIEIGPQLPLVAEVAELMCELTGQDRAAFCNTGSEAVLGAMRLSRTVTGRDTIVVFNNSYHGIFDEVVSRGTKKLTTIPGAPGIPRDSVKNLLILDYGTQESLDILRARADELAAIMVEPVQSRALDLQPGEFLQNLVPIARSSGAALIFDEVITGFRAHPGGAQAHFKVKADLATYGKIMGGGMPIGAITGRPEFMDGLDGGAWQFGDDSFPQVGVTYFAGTFVRHPLTMAAAKAALTHLKEAGPGLQVGLNKKMAGCVAEIRSFLQQYGAPLEIKHFSSAFRIAFATDLPLGELLYPWLRMKGIHIFQDRTFFLTTAHSEADIQALVQAVKETVVEMTEAGLLAPGNGRAAPKAEAVIRPESSDENGGVVRAAEPPLPGARLGLDPEGRPGWFVPDPERAGKYLKVQDGRSTQ